MGQWSPTFFGSDAALDVWDGMARSLDLLAMEEDFLPTPGNWDAKHEERIRDNAAALQDWAENRVRLAHADLVQHYRMSLAVLAAATDAEMTPERRAEAAALIEDRIRDLETAIAGHSARGITHNSFTVQFCIFRQTLDDLKQERGPLDAFTFLQYSALFVSGGGDTETVLTRLQRDLPGFPDIYEDGARDAFDKALGAPGFGDKVSELLAASSDEPIWSETSALTVILVAIALMSAGAPITDGFRALAKEAGANDTNDSAGRASIRGAYLEAVDIYREGECIVFGEENLAQAFIRHKGGGLLNQ